MAPSGANVIIYLKCIIYEETSFVHQGGKIMIMSTQSFTKIVKFKTPGLSVLVPGWSEGGTALMYQSKTIYCIDVHTMLWFFSIFGDDALKIGQN